MKVDENVKAPWAGRPSERTAARLVTPARTHRSLQEAGGACEGPAPCCGPSSGVAPRAVGTLPPAPSGPQTPAGRESECFQDGRGDSR